MTATATTLTTSLTGAWRGSYTHNSGTQRTEFSATLEQYGATLSGLIEEYSEEPDGVGRVHFARVEGRVAGASILFAKTYSGRAGWVHTIDYEGDLADDGNLIVGIWRFSATWVGAFEMRRASPAT